MMNGLLRSPGCCPSKATVVPRSLVLRDRRRAPWSTTICTLNIPNFIHRFPAQSADARAQTVRRAQPHQARSYARPTCCRPAPLSEGQHDPMWPSWPPAHRTAADRRAASRARPQRPAPQSGRPVARRAEDHPGRGRAGTVPRPPGLAVDLLARRHRFRPHDQHRQEDARSAGRAVRGRAAGDRRPSSVSIDGTRKWLLRFRRRQRGRDGLHPRGRIAARCASRARSAARSPAASATPARSRWCATSTPAEIVGQFMVARDSYGEWPTPTETTRMLTNIVMMGMGEPLYNFDNVGDGAQDRHGRARASRLQRRRITLSTSGVVPMIAAGRRGARRQSRRLAARRERRGARRRWCRSTANGRSPSCSKACAAYPGAKQQPAHHLRIRHAEGHQRQRRRRARAGAAADAASTPR